MPLFLRFFCFFVIKKAQAERPLYNPPSAKPVTTKVSVFDDHRR